MPEASPTQPRSTFTQVVMASGHMIDLPHRSKPRFPASDEPVVGAAVGAELRRWDVGPGTLVVSGGARGADIIVTEQALELRAEAWLLLALPDEEFVAASVTLPGTDWEERFRRLRRRCPTWSQADELGPATAGVDVFERNNDWCLAVAKAQAPPEKLRVLVVWDGAGSDGPGGTLHLVEQARSLGVAVEVVRPPSSRPG